MNRTRRTNTLTAVAVFVAVACITGSGILVNEACATVGTSDPVVVKAEDVLTNSLSVYTAAMNYHFANSTKETPAVYKSFEEFRAKFPVAWTALDNAKRSYKLDKSNGSAPVDSALNALSLLVSTVTPLIGVH